MNDRLSFLIHLQTKKFVIKLAVPHPVNPSIILSTFVGHIEEDAILEDLATQLLQNDRDELCTMKRIGCTA